MVWAVVELWKELNHEDVIHENVLVVVEGFRNEEEAAHYSSWIIANMESSKLDFVGVVEAKRPDPRYLETGCPHDCHLRVLHEGEHIKFKSS